MEILWLSIGIWKQKYEIVVDCGGMETETSILWLNRGNGNGNCG